jgi:hypothetical protein
MRRPAFPRPGPSAVSSSSRADKQRAYRARSRTGRACYTIELPEVDLELMLQDAGLLSPAEADDRERVEAALQRFVEVAIAQHLAR